MTDAVEESIPASIHRGILTRKSRRAARSKSSKQNKEIKKKEPNDQPSSDVQPDPPSQALHAEEPDQPNTPQEDRKRQALEPPAALPKKKRPRRTKEVVLSRPKKKQRNTITDANQQADQSDEEPSQMDILQQRLAALEERDRKLRNGTYTPSGNNHDFELNTNLSSFM